MTDTPETDAFAEMAHNLVLNWDCRDRGDTTEKPVVVDADFARYLERERDELRAKIAGMKQTGDEMASYISIVGDFRLNREGYRSSERAAFEDWKELTS